MFAKKEASSLLKNKISEGINTMGNVFVKDKDKAAQIKADIEKRAEALKKEILESQSNYGEVIGKIYYVSQNGDDSNDGLSQETPVKTLDAVSNLPLKAGDAVLFKRGEIFRGYLKSYQGVIYSAYGEGKKPVLTNSLQNFADPSLWEETEVKNVYKLKLAQTNDVGVIVFDEGKAWTQKRIKGRPEFPEGGLENLDVDLAMWHDIPKPLDETGYVYLRCDKGNPGELFTSIEIARRQNIASAKHDVTFDNICFKYGAAHGIGSGTVNGLTVRYCEFGWIGGSWFRTDTLSRYGNAIEIYGGCRNYVCDHNYIYQVYDAGITQQLKNGKGEVYMCDITYSYNLIEDTSYSVEYFLEGMKPEDIPEGEGQPVRYTKNFEIVGNIMRRSGYGFGEQRPDGQCAHIKGWKHSNPVMNYTIHDNIFDTARHMIHQIGAEKHEWMPKLWNNIYVSGDASTARFGSIGGLDFDGNECREKKIEYDENFERAFNEIMAEKNSVFVLEK